MEHKTRIVVLGAGLVGNAIARDLAQEEDYSVVAVDRDPQALMALAARAPVQTVRADLGQSGAVASLVADCELAVCAVPGFMGFETLKAVIEAGRNVVDISFFGQDAFSLDELARAQGVVAIVDCGVAPGLCNVLAGHVDTLLEQVDRYICYVGGLPQLRRWPYEYKAVFSPADVFEEYTRPAHLVEYGQEVVKPALSEQELLDFAALGTLEAFNTDGLRSLRKTLGARFMVEKTLRYPGHAQLMRVFRDSGFFDAQPVRVGEQMVRPIDLTSRLLVDRWRLEEGEEDLVVMRVIVEGKREGSVYRYVYELLDRYDVATQTTSMARTTGYTCAIVARQVLNRLFARQGICPPEYVGRVPACYENLMQEYAKRSIHVTETIAQI